MYPASSYCLHYFIQHFIAIFIHFCAVNKFNQSINGSQTRRGSRKLNELQELHILFVRDRDEPATETALIADAA